MTAGIASDLPFDQQPVSEPQASDPALNGGPGIFSATTKLAITEATVLFSFLCFTQSIRLQTHMVHLPSLAFLLLSVHTMRWRPLVETGVLAEHAGILCEEHCQRAEHRDLQARGARGDVLASIALLHTGAQGLLCLHPIGEVSSPVRLHLLVIPASSGAALVGEQVPCLCRPLSGLSVRLAHRMISPCLQLMWAAGPTWLLVITVLEVISLIFTDSIPLPKTMPYAAVEQQAKADIERGEPLLGKSQPVMSMCIME